MRLTNERVGVFLARRSVQDLVISKMLSNLSCLVSDHPSVIKKSNTLFNERRENLFKENIPAFSVQGKSQCLPEKSGDNHPKHFRKLIM